MNKKRIFLCAATLLGIVAAKGQNVQNNSSPTPADDRLAALKALRIDSGTITSAERADSPTLTLPDGHVQPNLPPRTIVKLVLNPAKGSNINVEMWLPDPGKWNGCLLGLGNGGAAGHINPATLSTPAAMGYAAVTTDMGTAPNADSGVGNPEVWKDFGFRATHLMTVVGKQLVKAFYGKPQDYSYFNGGSTGGQQALQEAQRYPDDYDGILASIAAHCRTPLHAYFLWNDQILAKCPFTKTQQDNVVAAGNEYMAPREAPAVAGKFVSDPRGNAKDIEGVIALAMKKDPTLTPEHAEALRKLFDGPRHAVTGERIFDGIPFGASFDGGHGNLYLFKWVFGARKKLADINFGEDIDTYTAKLGPYLNAENPDLSRFAQRGGKLIMTLGSADATVPYHGSVDYYERVATRLGGLEKVQAFFKFYIIPGMAHGGGPGVGQPGALFDAVRNWREKGTVPEMFVGKRVINKQTELELPIYPYPTKAVWDAATSNYKPVAGPRGGVDRIADRFLPPAAE
ncbi:MAG: tannase/feruloyl esterase family alpha/beta hydrolase [Rhodospirillales bacterium]|nr:tannase/feruloyl esterase family alpha/beta hydrolase [Acetobacter sp.]